MTFRRIIAAFLVFLFVVVSLPTFFVYAFSKTFFNGSFYSGPVSDRTYDFLIDTVTKNFYQSDTTLQRHFQETEINKALRDVFTPELFRTIMVDAGQQIEHLKEKPHEPVTLSLKVFRDSLLTTSYNLANKLFQSLPVCTQNQLPEVNEEGIPTCIPNDVDYAKVAGPLSKQFEKTIDDIFPPRNEQMQIDLSSGISENQNFVLTIFSNIDKIKIFLLISLLVLVLLIATFVYDRLSAILRYEAAAFLISGFLGILISFSFQLMPGFLLENYQKSDEGLAKFFGDKEHLQNLLDYIFSFPKTETQKMALIFVVLGAILLGIHFLHGVLRKKYADKT